MRRSTTVIYMYILFSCIMTVSYAPLAFSDEIPASTNPVDSNTVEPGGIYVDQVIDETAAADEYDLEDDDPSVLMPDWPPGTLGITYRYFEDNFDGTSPANEQGLSFRWRQETIENGTLELEADALMEDGDPQENTELGRFLLIQQDYMVSNDLEIDSELGHFRSFTPQLISRSYRFYLPSTILQGVGTQLSHGDTTVSLATGEIGGFSGTATQTFETTQGSLHGLGYTHTPSQQWDIAAQIWITDDPEQGDTHQSAAGAVQYQNKDGSQTHQLHTLSDNSGHLGGWVDNQFKAHRWHFYTGFFFLEPDLLWTDTQIDNDREGFYWRSEHRRFRWHWVLGNEISIDNIYKDPETPGYVHTSSFVNGTWRYRRNTSFGGSLYMDTQQPDSGTADMDNEEYSLKIWGRHQTSLGTTRIQPSLDRYESEIDPYTRYGLLWDQIWQVPFFNRMNSYVQYYQTSQGDDETNLRLMLSKSLPYNVYFSATGQYLVTDDHDYGVTRDQSLAMDASWQMHANWLMTLGGDYSVNMFEPDDATGDDETTDGYRLELSLRYAVGIGREPLLYGRPTGEKGRGQINGRVFFDENENGIYDLNEKGASNIVVYLDGRYRTQTDTQGRFEYWPVSAGEHTVQIGIEDAPLPWGLDDESPQNVLVPVRATTVIDFPLTRINE